MRKGLYDIIIVFFLIVVLVFAIIFFLYMNANSSLLYGNVKKQVNAPKEASVLLNALLACNHLDYLDASILDNRTNGCQANNMLDGFIITQYAMNSCPATVWDYQHEENGRKIEYTQSLPYVVAVEQQGGQRCLARLDVLVRGTS